MCITWLCCFLPSDLSQYCFFFLVLHLWASGIQLKAEFWTHVFVYLLPPWRDKDHPSLRNNYYRISPFKLGYYCANCDTSYYWKTPYFSKIPSFCSCLQARIWHRIRVVTFPDFFIEPEQNFKEAIAWERWEMVPESMKLWYCAAEMKQAASWHAMFKLSKNKTQSFALTILCWSPHFLLQYKKAYLCVPGLGCSIHLGLC